MLQNITLHYITFHSIPLYSITLHYITYTHIHTYIQTDIHTYIALHCITLHYITLQYITLHYITYIYKYICMYIKILLLKHTHIIHIYIYIKTQKNNCWKLAKDPPGPFSWPQKTAQFHDVWPWTMVAGTPKTRLAIFLWEKLRWKKPSINWG